MQVCILVCLGTQYLPKSDKRFDSMLSLTQIYASKTQLGGSKPILVTGLLKQLSQNHSQGDLRASILQIGLFYNDVIVKSLYLARTRRSIR